MTDAGRRIDPASTAAARLDVSERTELLVIGAGPAGIAAALEGRRRGVSVVLVDENPVAVEAIGEDIPHLYGGRASGSARNRNAMLEALLAARPGLEEAFAAEVDVRLGTACWGLYANGPSVGWLPGPVAGLSDGERAFMLGFDRAVVATGCRDMGVAFPGWDLPGVMGVQAAARLAELGALDSRRAVLLGTGAEAIAAARSLDVEIAAVVEVLPSPLADPAPLRAPILCAAHLIRAEGGLDGVHTLVVARDGTEHRIQCDTVLLGVGAVPVIELFGALGCAMVFDPGRGGHVPVLDKAGRTSLPFVAAAGDCGGTWPSKSADPAIAAEEGRRAAAAEPGSVDPDGSPDLAAYRMQWVKALTVEAGDGPFVCRCEEVTAREILEVRPPRYLGATMRPRNDLSLRALLGEGPPNPDLVKRLTRAGMGICQGRRCREQVACLLALGSGERLEDVPLATYRAPLRPLPLRLAQRFQESEDMRAGWDTWMGHYPQYVPFWDIAPSYTVASRPLDPEGEGEIAQK